MEAARAVVDVVQREDLEKGDHLHPILDLTQAGGRICFHFVVLKHKMVSTDRKPAQTFQ